jgi:magnesium chelatase family protein
VSICPCGYFGNTTKECTCSNQVITRYQKRISGPILDRIDIHTEAPRGEYDKISDDRLGEKSTSVQTRAEAARQIQRDRFADSNLTCNAGMRPGDIREHCQLDDPDANRYEPDAALGAGLSSSSQVGENDR